MGGKTGQRIVGNQHAFIAFHHIPYYHVQGVVMVAPGVEAVGVVFAQKDAVQNCLCFFALCSRLGVVARNNNVGGKFGRVVRSFHPRLSYGRHLSPHALGHVPGT